VIDNCGASPSNTSTNIKNLLGQRDINAAFKFFTFDLSPEDRADLKSLKRVLPSYSSAPSEVTYGRPFPRAGHLPLEPVGRSVAALPVNREAEQVVATLRRDVHRQEDPGGAGIGLHRDLVL